MQNRQLILHDRKIRVYISDVGKPYILFVHGWGGSHKSLLALAQLLETDFSYILVDLPGFGSSDNPDPDWGVEEYADLIRWLIDSLNITPVHYFGHSFGGSLGIYLAAKYPQYIHKLMLCNSSFKRTGKTSKRALQMKKMVGLLPGGSYVFEKTKLMLYRVFFPDSDISKFPHLESNFRKIVQQDLSGLLEKITAPTYVLWGKDDTYTPVSMANELHKKLPNSTLKIFPDIGHNLPIKHATSVYTYVKSFLQE